MNLRVVLSLGALLCASFAVAALPESVVKACLSPEIYDHTANKSWPIMTFEQWEKGSLEVQETATATILTAEGKPHPEDWLTTSVTLNAPTPTDDASVPMQTLTVTARAHGIVPQMMVDFVLVKEANLPPYKIQPWGNRIAIVAEAGNWYIVTGDPAMTVTQAETPERALTITLAKRLTTPTEPARATLLVGEGPLPPAVAP